MMTQGCLETLQSNAVKQYAFLTICEGSAINPTNLIFLCLANNYISVIVQGEHVLNAGLHLFRIRDIGFPL